MDLQFRHTSLTMGYRVDDLKFLHLPPEILLKILNFLDPSTILTSRLVNSTWTTLSNKSIRQIQGQSDNFTLHFERNSYSRLKRREFFTLEKNIKPHPKKILTDLSNFLHLIETDLDSRGKFQRLPFQNFSFCDKTFESSELQQFIQSNGGEIRTLALDFEYTQGEDEFIIGRVSMLKQLLTTEAPNIQSFSLYLSQNWQYRANLIDFATNDSNGQQQQLTLPLLKKFEIDMDNRHQFFPFVGTILKSAVNLNFFGHNRWAYYFQDLSVYYPTLLSLDKVWSMKFLQFIPNRTSHWLTLYEKLASTKPGLCNLENIVVDSHLDPTHEPPEMVLPPYEDKEKFCTRVFQLLIKILECSALTLEKMVILEMSKSAQFFPPGFSVHFPSFPKMKILTLNRSVHHRDKSYPPLSCSIPPPVEWNRIFSNLTHLNLALNRMEGGKEEWTKFFENTLPIKNVKELYLDLQEQIDPGSTFFETLSKVFCEVKSLTLYLLRFPLAVMPHVWKYFGSIRKFHLILILCGGTDDEPILSREENDYYLDFDPLFTGFSKEDCHRLREGWAGAEDREKFVEETMGKIEELRRGPSILDLTELRDLIIEFDIYGDMKDPGPYKPLSPVTGEFGFGMTKHKLNVQLLVDKQYNKVMRKNVRDGMEEMKLYADVQLVRMEH